MLMTAHINAQGDSGQSQNEYSVAMACLGMGKFNQTDLEYADLPKGHQHALLSARWYGGKIHALTGDLFVSSTSISTLKDLVGLGLLRKNLASWELTLAGWEIIGDRRLSH